MQLLNLCELAEHMGTEMRSKAGPTMTKGGSYSRAHLLPSCWAVAFLHEKPAFVMSCRKAVKFGEGPPTTRNGALDACTFK